ncbi:unnamed protein product [Symbiodinium necroappetens]|uniref:EF-hand domain-containing protein n=1 Tax=Symbiodinium necroappetens TaxID=1628268 RepID=A0A812VAA4_9DINO|nr:unnamed protein product [Symbiodinium necroappetens]
MGKRAAPKEEAAGAKKKAKGEQPKAKAKAKDPPTPKAKGKAKAGAKAALDTGAPAAESVEAKPEATPMKENELEDSLAFMEEGEEEFPDICFEEEGDEEEMLLDDELLDLESEEDLDLEDDEEEVGLLMRFSPALVVCGRQDDSDQDDVGEAPEDMLPARSRPLVAKVAPPPCRAVGPRKRRYIEELLSRLEHPLALVSYFLLQEYVNPVLQEMVMSLLKECPRDPERFMLRWLLEQETFDRCGINSLEDAAREQEEINALRQQVAELKRQRAQMKARLANVVAEERKKRGLPTPPTLDTKTVKKIKNCILRAAYAGWSGVDLALLFRRLDKDRSGELEIDEVKAALRRVLRIPPSVVPDYQIQSFCAIMDTDFSGAVDIEELVGFIQGEGYDT